MGGPRKSKKATVHNNPDPLLSAIGSGAHVKADEKAAFIAWLAVPESLRPEEIPTQSEFGRIYDVTPTTLSLWKKDPRVMREVFKQVGASVRIEWLPEIMRSMYLAATQEKRPDVAAARLVVKVIDDASVLINEGAESKPIEAMSMAELQDELDNIAELLETTLEAKKLA